MVKPILRQAYRPSHATDIRQTFELERQRLATAHEHAAALQFVRKISGFARPSAANEEAFNRAVGEVAKASSKLLNSLVTTASPKNR